MRVFRSPLEIPAGFGPSVVTIGNFDGVHAGHREILRRAVAIAKTRGLTSVAMTFDPHPAQILAPARAPKLLMTIGQRLRKIASAGVDAALLLPFSAEFARISPEDFARDILHATLHARAVLVGEDFRFGAGQAGNVGTLRELGQELGFEVDGVAHIGRRGVRISSTRIRMLVTEGRVSNACRMLGGPFALEGMVVRGHGIGAKQTVPTLNLEPRNEMLPKTGVYVTRTRELSEAPTVAREWPSITNVGFRPTFGGDELTVETFLLSALGGEAPEAIEVSFLCFVRDETRFASPEALKAQIIKDVGKAQRLHRRLAVIRVT